MIDALEEARALLKGAIVDVERAVGVDAALPATMPALQSLAAVDELIAVEESKRRVEQP